MSFDPLNRELLKEIKEVIENANDDIKALRAFTHNLYTTFQVIEKSCGVMYEFMMKEKMRAEITALASTLDMFDGD